MVIRKDKKNRKFHGTRRWGVGNIKNARGAGSRGGVGGLNRLRKHDWTYFTAKAPELIKKKGFAPWKRSRLDEVTLAQVNELAKRASDPSATLDFPGTKVIGNGSLERVVTVRAVRFSKQAEEKIKGAGGQAVRIKEEAPKEEKKPQAK